MIKSATFSKLNGNNVYLKLECLQKTGSFKVRGAMVKIHNMSDELKKNGVIAASAGNHAQAVAFLPNFMIFLAPLLCPKMHLLVKLLPQSPTGPK